MIRFINIKDQIDRDGTAFAWYDTVTDRFLQFDGDQVWNSVAEFMLSFQKDEANFYKAERFLKLIPEEFNK